MEFQSFLIKYSEIGIKGKNRYVFEDKLVSQIARKLKTVEGQFSVSKVSGRIYVQAEAPYDYDETIDALQHVFGIAGICPQVQLPDEGFEELKRQVVAYMDEMYPDKNITFKVIARRANKHYPIDSNEINARLGEAILDAFPEIQRGCASSGCIPLCRGSRDDQYLLRDYSRSRRHAGRNRTEKPCCFSPAVSTAR